MTLERIFGQRIGVFMRPLRLSQAIEIVARAKQSGRRRPHWYDSPVTDLISNIGDKQIDRVTPDDIALWYDSLHTRHHQRQPDRTLSAWTIDSYGRAVRAFFNALVDLGHLEVSPARHLRLPRLPPKRKKEIRPEDIERMVAAAEYNARDHAIVLVLRDSGIRVGELIDMTAEGLIITEDDQGQLGGRILIMDEKTSARRWGFIGHDACLAVQRYIRSRPFDSPTWLWLSHRSGKRLTKSGVYQILGRLADRAGVAENWNPHAFRHALAKRLINQGAPAKVIQGLLGHADVSTTLNMYITLDDDELAGWHKKFVR